MEPGLVVGGRYRLASRLGRGGMGEVWASHDELLDRPVAVKILLAVLDDDPELAARLRQEARTAAALRHPAITVVHDVGDHDGHPYFVMELLTGRTFAALRSENGGTLPIERALALMAQVADGLAYAHNRGVVHRDIKPENLISDSGGVKICDFGIAHYAQASARFTKTGHTVGTAPFMAPEQWRADPVDARTDLYAFGVTLYLLVAAETPFAGPSFPAFAHQHLEIPPPRLSGVPANLADLVDRLLAKKAADRPASASEVAETLRAIRDNFAGAVGPQAPTVHKRRSDRPSAGQTTLTNTRAAMLRAGIRSGIRAFMLFVVVLCVSLPFLAPSDSWLAFGPWPVMLLTGVLIGVVAGCVVGTLAGLLSGSMGETDTVTLDNDQLTVTQRVRRKVNGKVVEISPRTFSVRWDALEHLAIEGKTHTTTLVGRFRPANEPPLAWAVEHGLQRREDGSYAIYGPTDRDLEKVDVGRLRDALPRYFGS
ncbi:hypothetical protein GCM10009765_21220 [Fodinicola feengrottensis]|uniref:non-specific serine/threonine protein kinase n=1 Tax=Fodinicola feengrottensis TaxID=435914 RepID=A0ABP4SE41_9ACTN